MSRMLSLLLLLVLPLSASADCSSKRKEASTPYGVLYEMHCSVSGRSDAGYEYSLFLDDQLLIKDSFLRYEDNNDEQSVWVFGGRHALERGCTSRQYLIDISKKPAQVLAFGVNGACSEFHWAKWSKRKSVIALKRNVKFVYQNSALTPPKRDDDLFSNVKTYADNTTPVNAGKIFPFVENIGDKGN